MKKGEGWKEESKKTQKEYLDERPFLGGAHH